jgi:hypothetical protein
MTTEFNMQLLSGRMIIVTVESDVVFDCDCSGGDLHPHVVSHEILECVDIDSGLDVQMTDEVRQEIEDFADDKVYNEVEQVREWDEEESA